MFRKLAQEFPDAPEYRDEARVRVNLGMLLGQQEKYAEAEAQYREALRLRPDYPEAHANLGIALACQGKDAEAEAEYRQALDLRPDDPRGFLYLGIALARQRKFAAAVRLFAEALAAEPKLAEDPSTDVPLQRRLLLRRWPAAARASDAAKLDDAERARLRRQALDWLRADLAAWGQLLEKQPDQACPACRRGCGSGSRTPTSTGCAATRWPSCPRRNGRPGSSCGRTWSRC